MEQSREHMVEFWLWLMSREGAVGVDLKTLNFPTRGVLCQSALNRVDVGTITGGTNAAGFSAFSGIENGEPFTDRPLPAHFEGAFTHPAVNSVTVFAISNTQGAITHSWDTIFLL
ncbi:hypothetical protein E6W39_10325 [Kitasatospora acidiphila]|uniref:Uncharacterized protein n=1 Tax=Kitasatospora acidiphila TaxID=2567942 RepID=A0A540W0P2_9ACTN|nr:hypothetical protein [Kitasatospora acidiphila]TQF02585.1 hypothetical protein E6W39_10325 [Kitasatospora acidiphila]